MSADFQVVIIFVMLVVFCLSHRSYLQQECVSAENETEPCKGTLSA